MAQSALLRRNRARQYRKINPALPINRGLTAHYDFAQGTMYSAVPGLEGSPSSVASSFVVGPDGEMCLYQDGYSSNDGTYGINTRIMPDRLGWTGATPRSFIVEFDMPDSNLQGTLFLLGDENANDNAWMSICRNNGIYRSVLISGYGNDLYITTHTREAVPARVWLAAAYDGNLTWSWLSIATYPDGTREITTSSGTLSRPLGTQNYTPFKIGTGRYLHGNTGNMYRLSLYGNRALTIAEMRALHRNPDLVYADRLIAASSIASSTIASNKPVLPRRFADKQTSTPLVNRRHPLASDILFAFNGASDYVEGGKVALVGSDWGKRAPTANGLGVITTATDWTAGVAYDVQPTSTKEITLLYVALENSNPTDGTWCDPISIGDGTGSNLVLEMQGGSGNLAAYAVGSWSNMGLGFATPTTNRDGKIHTTALTLSASNNLSVMYLDGKSIFSSNYSVDTTFNRVGLANRTEQPNGRGYVCNGYLAAFVFRRALTAAEIAQITANPWQLFVNNEPKRYAVALPAVAVSSTPQKVILPKRGLSRQPQGEPRIDRSNPLNSGMLALVSGSSVSNNVSGALLSYQGSIPVKRAARDGIVELFSHDHYLQTETLPAIGTNDFVEFWYGVPNLTRSVGNGWADFVTGTTASQSGGIFQQNNSSLPSAASWGYNVNWNENNAANTEAGQVPALDNLTDGVPTLLIAVRRGTTLELWRDGQLKRLVTGVQYSNASSQWAMTFGSFVNDVNYWSTRSQMYLAGRKIGAWSTDQIISFSNNPWQLFEAKTPRLYATAATVSTTVTVKSPALPRFGATQQPRQSIRINKRHPLAAGISEAYVPAITERAIVSGAVPTSTGPMQRIAGPSGLAALYTTNVAKHSTTILNGKYAAWLVIVDFDNSSSDGMGFRKDGCLTVAQGFASSMMSAVWDSSNNLDFRELGPKSAYTGTTRTFFGKKAPTNSFAASDVPGHRIDLSNTVLGTTTNPLCIGGIESDTVYPSQRTVLVVLWEGSNLPTESQLIKLAENPWQLFESESPRLYASTSTTVSTVPSLPIVPNLAILPRFGAGKQPISKSRLKYNSPILRGATSALIVSGNAGDQFVTDSSLLAGIAVGKDGLGFRSTSINNGLSWTTKENIQCYGAAPKTMFARFTINNLSVNSSLLAIGNPGTSNLYSFSVYQGQVILHFYGDFITLISSPVIGMTYDLAAAYDGTTVYIFVNGVKTLTYPKVLNINQTPLYVGGSGEYFSQSADSVLWIAGVIGKCLTEPEAKMLSDNPYQVFESNAPRVLPKLSAASIPGAIKKFLYRMFFMF